MLTVKEVKSLPKGFIPNSYLRSKFGTKHGHVVKARYTKDGAQVDTEFIGNRQQYKFRMRNQLAPLPEIEKAVYHSNKIESKKKKNIMTAFFEYIKELIYRLKGGL